MQNLTSPLEVKTSKLPFILAVFLGLFFVPFGLWSLFNSILKGFAMVPLIMGLMMLALYSIVVWLVFRGYFKSAKLFTVEGVTRNDGQKFAWTELSRVVDQVRFNPTYSNGKGIWRTEIQFQGGESAWLIPMKINNFKEVREFVTNLPCEHTEEKV